MYTLNTPIKSRKNGEDVTVHELPIPEVITVGMLRQIPDGNDLLKAHALTDACAGLSAMESAKLETPDALAYSQAVAHLLDANDKPGFKLPELRPVRAVLAKVTASPSQPIEFAAQVLQANGMSRQVIDAMDARDFLPAVPVVVESFINPKS